MPPFRIRPRTLTRRPPTTKIRTQGKKPSAVAPPSKPKATKAQGGTPTRTKRSNQRRNARQTALEVGTFAGKTVAIGGAVGVGGFGLGRALSGLGEGVGNVFEERDRPKQQRQTLVDLARLGALTPEIAGEVGGSGGQDNGVQGFLGQLPLIILVLGIGGIAAFAVTN